MIKTHEISLELNKYNNMNLYNCVIIPLDNTIEANDYILFKQINDQQEFTGLHSLIIVDNIITENDLKDNYMMITVRKLS